MRWLIYFCARFRGGQLRISLLLGLIEPLLGLSAVQSRYPFRPASWRDTDFERIVQGRLLQGGKIQVAEQASFREIARHKRIWYLPIETSGW